MTAIAKTVFRTLLIASFAVWFGGFTFYVSFVVPIGTEVLGSAREQGFITRQVAHRLHVMCAIALAVMLIESVASWRGSGKAVRSVQAGSVIGIGVLLGGLVYLHPQLDQLLDVDSHRVLDRATFYRLHRVYLWVSTFQWVFAWTWLFVVLQSWYNESRASTKTPA